MTKLDIQYDILNNTPATASPVEANFNRIEAYVNQELIERSGTVAMTGPLQLAGNPETPLAAAPKQYVDAILPIGIIMSYGGVAAPPGGTWGVCNGAEMETAVYPELFAVLSTTYSPEGTPAGRFNLPNLVDRFAIGAGAIATIGKTGGSRDAVVTQHTHGGGSTGVDNGWHNHAVSIQSGTESAYHDHWPPIDFFDFVVARRGGGTADPHLLAPGPGNVGWAAVTKTENQTHTHPVAGTTGDQNSFHIHPIAAEGVTGVDANLPPYLGVTPIIRIK